MIEYRDPGQIEASLGAVEAVGSVVSAIRALARAQLPRVERAVAETGTWLEWLDRVVDEIAGPPLDDEPARTLTVVIGPERPFCGSLARVILEAVPADGPLALVGTRLCDVGLDGLRDRVRFTLAGAGGVDDLGTAAERLATALLAELAGEPLRVALLHPGAARPTTTLLLPTRRGAPVRARDVFSPPERVAAAAARESVSGHLHAALAGALLAEVRMRLVAAERARRAVDDREAELSSALRVLEREQITSELIELAAASEAGGVP